MVLAGPGGLRSPPKEQEVFGIVLGGQQRKGRLLLFFSIPTPMYVSSGPGPVSPREESPGRCPVTETCHRDLSECFQDMEAGSSVGSYPETPVQCGLHDPA